MPQPLQTIDNFLNSITMYKLVLYGLLAIIINAIALGFTGYLPFTGLDMIGSLLGLTVLCFSINLLCSKILKAPFNTESSTITALILFLIIAPYPMSEIWSTLVLASILAMLSKFILSYRRKHIFNPAAIALVILGLLGNPYAFWWVASLNLMPLTLIVGLLVVRKIHREWLFGAFALAALTMITVFGLKNQTEILPLLRQSLTSWPIIFLGTIMLTEPLTTPPAKRLQLVYGALVGILFGSQYSIGPIYSTPELALVIGNVFSFLVSPKIKLFLKLKSKKKLAQDTWQYSFVADRPLNFKPGQYMEWTLPMTRTDSRGNRRYFTLANAPTEDLVQLGIRHADTDSSAFKLKLRQMEPGDPIVADHLSGDFVMPEDPTNKLAFVAGGIGVTPFRSMIKYLIDKKQPRDVTLYYANRYENEIAYSQLFEEAESIGVKSVYMLSGKDSLPRNWRGEVGYLTEEIIKKHTPDFLDRRWYLSGPSSMVSSYDKLLRSMGMPSNQIIKDYFPGF